MFGFVEERAGVKALSFVDDVAWWAEGRNETEIAGRLTNAATYAVKQNTGFQVDGQTVKFNKQATRWLGIWIDSSLSLKDHHQTMKKARNAQKRMRRLTGRVGLVPENVRRTQVVCVQAVAMHESAMVERREGERHYR